MRLNLNEWPENIQNKSQTQLQHSDNGNSALYEDLKGMKHCFGDYVDVLMEINHGSPDRC